MKGVLILLAALGVVSHAQAADITAGKEKAGVCAACHGANGVSVSGDIPNLAGQKAQYIETQLKAFRAETRKNPLMNAIAAQLEDSDIADLAAFFNSLPGAAGDATSELVAEVVRTRVRFPKDYQTSFTQYMTINFPKRPQVRKYYANQVALTAARDGKPLPNGSVLFVEVFKPQLDGAGKPVKGGDGFFVADTLAVYTAMEMQAGWGEEVPEMLRNGDWNYAVFTPDKSHKKGINQAKCFACHKPLTEDSFVFSLDKLRERARQ